LLPIHAAHPDTATLSLHDALPISEGAIADIRPVDVLDHGNPRTVTGADILIIGNAPPRLLLGRECGLHHRADGHRARISDHGRRSEEHTSELQSRSDLVCRLPLEK